MAKKKITGLATQALAYKSFKEYIQLKNECTMLANQAINMQQYSIETVAACVITPRKDGSVDVKGLRPILQKYKLN